MSQSWGCVKGLSCVATYPLSEASRGAGSMQGAPSPSEILRKKAYRPFVTHSQTFSFHRRRGRRRYAVNSIPNFATLPTNSSLVIRHSSFVTRHSSLTNWYIPVEMVVARVTEVCYHFKWMGQMTLPQQREQS